MSEIDTGYGFPYIPLSRLRELRQHAEMMAIATQQGAFNGSDLWRVYVGLEVNSLLANHWYGELDKARNYNPVAATACPLCVYQNGEFIASCGYHQQIDQLRVENSKLHAVVNEIFLTVSKRIEDAKEKQETRNSESSRTTTKSEGSRDSG